MRKLRHQTLVSHSQESKGQGETRAVSVAAPAQVHLAASALPAGPRATQHEMDASCAGP